MNRRERGVTRAALLVPKEGERVRGAGNRAEGIPSPLHPLSERERGGSGGGVNREGRGGGDCPSGPPGTRERGAGCGMWGQGVHILRRPLRKRGRGGRKQGG